MSESSRGKRQFTDRDLRDVTGRQMYDYEHALDARRTVRNFGLKVGIPVTLAAIGLDYLAWKYFNDVPIKDKAIFTAISTLPTLLTIGLSRIHYRVALRHPNESHLSLTPRQAQDAIDLGNARLRARPRTFKRG